MKRRGKRVLGIGGAGVIAVAGVATAAVVNLQGANASEPTTTATSSGADGYAAQNGGTTGGAGGTTVTATTGTEIHEALCGRASEDTPIIIQVKGTITVDNTEKVSGSCNTAAGVIELKGISNVTLVGVGSSAVFDQIGVHVRDSSNIILQNFTVKNVKKSGTPTSNGGDAVGMEKDVSNVWADHLTLEASGGEDDGYDALFDMKSGTQYVTLSYSILRNSGRGGLVGSSDSDTGNGPVTYHHNIYENIDSRTPLLRAATAHIYNNYYVGLTKSGINPRNGGKALVQNNYFKDSKNVLGTFYTDLKGTYQTSGNVLDNVTWGETDSENFPAGASMTSTGTVTVPYTATMDTAANVPSILAKTAGAGTGLAVSDGSGSTTTPSTSTTTTSSTTPSTSTTTTTPVTTTTTSGSTSGTNLALSAGTDGSSKASGSRYGNVNDGDATTYWSPNATTGDVSLKWSSAQTVSKVVIKEAAAKVTSWQLIDETNDDAVLASGTSAGTASFSSVSTKKLTLVIKTASGTPQIAELEAYAS